MSSRFTCFAWTGAFAAGRGLRDGRSAGEGDANEDDSSAGEISHDKLLLEQCRYAADTIMK